METSQIGNKGKWNIGDFVHFLEVAALLISIGVNYGRFTQIEQEVGAHTRALARIEHYLTSQDKDYWRKAHQNGDNDQ
jgi:hypothetical protein